MYPISDLTAFCRRTTGDVPPKLVGASTTVVGSKMYLYGGRLVSERKMVSDIYMFDLETFRWERLHQHFEDDVPQARYFHSADTWRNHLIIFGGMAIRPHSDNPEDLCVLNDVRMFDLTTGHWLPSTSTASEGSPPSFIPNARYAHLSSVSADRLFVIGGQDLANVWLDDVYIYDLAAKAWVQRREYSRHCGTYRSVAVTADMRVRLPQEELRTAQPSSSSLGPAGSRFKVNKAAPTASVTQSESLVYLPYSAPPTDDYPCDIFLFSNYNFTDVQRELEVFSPLSDGDFTVSDRSGSMTGTSFPPGLRFPTGAILGTYFIVAGTYLSQTYQSFSIWALDLINMTWARIDPGSALSTGSWFRSCLWPAENKFMVFGNRHGNLVEDYNRRLLSWDHVTCIDLEAFGIYQPPPLVFDIRAQELGLATLEESVLTDFEIVCDDGRKVKCSRKVLEKRWPWFREQLRMFVQSASQMADSMPMIPQHVALPELSGAYDQQQPRPDPRLTPRSFHLSEPYPITLALVQYFYSMALITPLQHAPAVLSQLLLLSSTYELYHLQSLVKHAMHRALSYATSVGIYGIATLCNCRSLQIRALRVVMAYSQKRPAGGRSRTDRDGSSGSRNHGNTNGNGADRSGTGGSGGGSSSDAHAAARPRGMSDASYLRGPSEASGSSSRDSPTPTALSRSDVSSISTSRPRAMSEIVAMQSHLPLQPVEVHGLRGKSLMSTAHRNEQSLVHASSDSVSSLPRSDPAQKFMVSRSEAVGRERSDSAASLSTDRELSALMELISPTDVDDDERSVTPSRGPRPRASSSSLLDVYRSSEVQCAGGIEPRTSLSSSTSSAAGSLYADSDAECFPDAFCDAAVFSPAQAAYPAFHLPLSPRLRSHWDTDTPSLKTSPSLTSLSTPSLSRTSSFHRSPPVSPTSLALATPVDVVANFSHGVHPLQVIEEARLPEDTEGSQELYGDERATASLPSLGSEPLHVATPLARGGSHGPILRRPRSSSRIVYDRGDIETHVASPDTIVPNVPSRSSSSIHTPKTPPVLKSPRGVKVFARLFAKEKPIVDEPIYEHLSSFNDLALSLSLDKAEERKARNKEIRAEKLALEKSRAALATQTD